MRKKHLKGVFESGSEINIYADKSSLILQWILLEGIKKEFFSIREIFREKGVSIGLVQKVVTYLVQNGYLKVNGIRTSKTYSVLNGKALLRSWIDHYSIIKKCRMWSYSSIYQGAKELEEIILKSKNQLRVVKSLHSASSSLNCKHTNLDTLELYMIEPNQREKIETELALEPRERGYEVLLIEPYYKQMVKESELTSTNQMRLPNTSPLLTFLDLFHFPLRGLEQAEYLSQKFKEIKNIYG